MNRPERLQGSTLEFAVARLDGRLEIPRYSTRDEAEGYLQHLRDLKEQHRADCEAWEAEQPAEGLHPSGTNESWWRWHKEGWKDRDWQVVVREVSAWRST